MDKIKIMKKLILSLLFFLPVIAFAQSPTTLSFSNPTNDSIRFTATGLSGYKYFLTNAKIYAAFKSKADSSGDRGYVTHRFLNQFALGYFAKTDSNTLGNPVTLSYFNTHIGSATLYTADANILSDRTVTLNNHSVTFFDAQGVNTVSMGLSKTSFNLGLLNSTSHLVGLLNITAGTTQIGAQNLSTGVISDMIITNAGMKIRDLFGLKGLENDADYFANSTDNTLITRKGAIALGDSIKSTISAGGYVPYTGATTNVDLGAHSLTSQQQYVTGTGGSGFVDLVSETSPASVSGHLRIYADSLNRLSWKNSAYRRTIRVARPADQTITVPYRSNPIIADSTDVAAVTNRKQDSLGTSGPATMVFGALRPVYDTVHAVNTWAFVSDAVHSPSPAFTSISTTSTYIQLNYSTFSRVNFGLNVNDEAMSSLGIFAGISVGVGSSKIYIYRQLDDYVEATYTLATTSWALTGNNLAGASISYNTTSKIFTFTNTSWGVIPQNISVTMHSPDGTLANNTNKYVPIPFSYSVPNTINFRLLKLTGDYLPALTDGLKIIFHYSGIVQINPSTFNFNIVGGSANFWVLGLFKR